MGLFDYYNEEEEEIDSPPEAAVMQAYEEALQRSRAEAAVGSLSETGIEAERIRELAEPGLGQSVKAARETYASLGQQLDRPGVSRQQRRLLREARRLLERVWGIAVVRTTTREPDSKGMRLRSPVFGQTELGPGGIFPQAVAVYERRYEPAIRGSREVFVPVTVFYGPDATRKADQVYLLSITQEIRDLKKEQKELLGKGLIEAKKIRKERVDALLRAREAELKAFKDARSGSVTPEPPPSGTRPSSSSPPSETKEEMVVRRIREEKLRPFPARKLIMEELGFDAVKASNFYNEKIILGR